MELPELGPFDTGVPQPPFPTWPLSSIWLSASLIVVAVFVGVLVPTRAASLVLSVPEDAVTAGVAMMLAVDMVVLP